LEVRSAEKTLRSALETVLTARFGPLPAEVAAVLRSASMEAMNGWLRNAATAGALGEVGILTEDRRS
jgi:hypothetical protein